MTATTSRACRQRATWYDDDIRNREADENHERRASTHPSWLRARDPLGKLGAHASNVHLWPPALPILCMRPHPPLRDHCGAPWENVDADAYGKRRISDKLIPHHRIVRQDHCR